MKHIDKILLFLLLTLISGIGLNSCTKDPVTIVTPKTVDQYVSEQSAFVNSELVFTRSILTVGYNMNEYSVSLNAVTATKFVTIKAAYLNALKADSSIIVSPDVTIPQIVAGNQTLGTPGKAFRGAINLCDKKPLNDAIVAANTLNASVPVGTTIGTVPQAAKTAFTTAITAASKTRDASTTVIDRQITDALAKLKGGTDAFNAAIIK